MRLVALVLIALTSVARADTSVAVVVSGADSIHAVTLDLVERWLDTHKLPIAKSPLPKDGLNTLLNCLVISDIGCARGVVDARAKVGNIIAVTGQVTGKHEKRSIQLSAYWIAKQHEVVSLQRTCDACTDSVLATTLDAMLGDLAKLAPTMRGTVHVTSVPAGLSATVDNDAAGATPFNREVSFGTHMISITRDGRVVAQKKVDVTPAATIEVPITVPDEPQVAPAVTIVEVHHSRAVPVVLLTVGVAAAVTGGVLWKYGGPTGDSYTYRNMRPAAIATGISGGVAILVGGIWLLRGGKTTSHPEVSVTPTETTVGWARSF